MPSPPLGAASSSSAPPASRRTAKIGCTMRCSVRPARLIASVVESTRKGMSSLTSSSTVWRDAQPSSARVGASARSLGAPAVRCAPSCHSDSSAPARSSTLRPASSSSSSCSKQPALKASKAAWRSAGSRVRARASRSSRRARRKVSVDASISRSPVGGRRPRVPHTVAARQRVFYLRAPCSGRSGSAIAAARPPSSATTRTANAGAAVLDSRARTSPRACRSDRLGA